MVSGRELLQSHPMHFRGKRRRLETEQSSGAVDAIDFSSSLIESFQDEIAFVPFEITDRSRGGAWPGAVFARLSRFAGFRASIGVETGPQAQIQLTVARPNDGSFDDVLQLADVSWPFVGLQ